MWSATIISSRVTFKSPHPQVYYYYTENVLHLAGLVFQVMCLAYSIHLMYYTTSLLDGELLGFVSHFFLLNASPMFSMCDGWVEKVWQQYLCSSTQPVFSVHLLFFCLQDMVFLSWAHFFSSLKTSYSGERFSPSTSKPRNLWRPALTSSTTHFFASLMPPFYFFHFFLKRETDLVKIDCYCVQDFLLEKYRAPNLMHWDIGPIKAWGFAFVAMWHTFEKSRLYTNCFNSVVYTLHTEATCV